jgi:hypothetical protein
MSDRFLPRAAAAALCAALTTVAVVPPAGASQQPADVGATATLQQRGSIVGTAWRQDNTPLPNARLRLRNVATGRSVATTTADASGRFAFNDVAPGVYLVELVDDDDALLAISETFTVDPGTTVATAVRLGARAPWFIGFFGNAATVVIATAAAIGVSALGSGGQPASPRQ